MGNLFSWGQLRRDFRFGGLLQSVIAGLVTGLVTVLATISLTALVFSGNLTPFLQTAIEMTLLGIVIVVTFITITSGFPCIVAAPPCAVATVLSIFVSSNVSAISQPKEAFVTALAIVAVSAFFTGFFLCFLGKFKLGSLIRYIPYPVIGGFLAGTGWLLILGSFIVFAGIPLNFSTLPLLMEKELLFRCFVAFAFGLILFIGYLRSAMPIVFLGSIIVFFFLSLISSYIQTDSAHANFFLGPFDQTESLNIFDFSNLNLIHWSKIFSSPGNIATIVFFSSLTLLLSVTSIEIALQTNVEINGELYSAGLANILNSFSCGLVGSHNMSSTTISYKMGASTRWVGLTVAIVCMVVFLLGTQVLSIIPKSFLGGLLLFFGFQFLYEWVFVSWKKLPFADYAIVLLILLTIGTVGLLEGISIGIVVSSVLFVVNYSKINAIKFAFTGSNYHSYVDRPIEETQIIKQEGTKIRIITLQGHIFFGTTDKLFNTIQNYFHEKDFSEIEFILLDFGQITGLDFSAALGIMKIKQLCEKKHSRLILISLAPELKEMLQKGGLEIESSTDVIFFDDLDHSLEWCENWILHEKALGKKTQVSRQSNLRKQLGKMLENQSYSDQMMEYLERMTLSKGEKLINQGDLSDTLYFIESGRVTVFMEIEGYAPKRLRTFTGGSLVGEIGFYLGLPRVASVVVEKPSVIYSLAREGLKKMNTENPALVSSFNKFIVRLVGRRLVDTNGILESAFKYRVKKV